MAIIIAQIDDEPQENVILEARLKKCTIFYYTKYSEYINSPIEHDFIICDLNMPDYSFEKLVEIIKKEGVPFVFYTNSPICAFNKSNVKAFKDIGVTEFFQKGKDDEPLFRMINKLGEVKKSA